MLLPSSPMSGFHPPWFLPSATFRKFKKWLGHYFMGKKKKKIKLWDLDFCLGKTLLKDQGKGHSYGVSLESQPFSQNAGEAHPHATERCWQHLSIKFQWCFLLRRPDHRSLEAGDLSRCFWRCLIQPSTKLDQLEELASRQCLISPSLDSSQPLLLPCPSTCTTNKFSLCLGGISYISLGACCILSWLHWQDHAPSFPLSICF